MHPNIDEVPVTIVLNDYHFYIKLNVELWGKMQYRNFKINRKEACIFALLTVCHNRLSYPCIQICTKISIFLLEFTIKLRNVNIYLKSRLRNGVTPDKYVINYVPVIT